MGWFTKKEKLPTKEFDIEGFKAQLITLPKDSKLVYILWFESNIPIEFTKVLRQIFDDHGLVGVIINGTKIPAIYKLEVSE